MNPDTPFAAPSPRRERAVNAPWTVLGLTGLLVAAFAWQINAPDTTGVIYSYGVVPAQLTQGRWGPLLTHIFLHGDWLHLFLNATALLAFGAPTARLMGSGPLGALRFFSFFLVTGVMGAAAYWALQPDATIPVVGASGAISGLMGGTARLLADPRRVGSPVSGPALRFLLPWVAINLVIAGVGQAAPGGLLIAWEAHLGGMFAGLLLIGVFAAGRSAPKRSR